jgi:hypothetical protein
MSVLLWKVGQDELVIGHSMGGHANLNPPSFTLKISWVLGVSSPLERKEDI